MSLCLINSINISRKVQGRDVEGHGPRKDPAILSVEVYVSGNLVFGHSRTALSCTCTCRHTHTHTCILFLVKIGVFHRRSQSGLWKCRAEDSMCKSFMLRSLFQIIFKLQFRPYLIFMTRYAKGYSQIIYWLIFRDIVSHARNQRLAYNGKIVELEFHFYVVFLLSIFIVSYVG